ncbi:LytTR family transcriptional regulator [Kaistella sp. G5-32]|uniref:LytTR family transcriptional regulator n=1 Tax=Kaistella gelatinilytica TaxID=2787636 RepID=A0ABS0F7C5_9FLAO|nr:LytTR family DNA-binding domain-containing protein [Kaistella gelatinilytica]MBF8455600.1 LytTR family transcriptional regulator [Kaistella gelatinilytica]
MLFKRSIAYTSNWFHTLLLTSILAVLVVFILIFLQPFNTYAIEIPHKNIKVLGYGICIIIPLLFIHVFEQSWFKLNHQKWYLYQEIIVLFSGLLLISSVSYFYNTIVINHLEIEPKNILKWSIIFGLPFAPIFIPFWAYLRFAFSKIVIQPVSVENKIEIVINGNNQNEEVKFSERNFLMANAQSNYVDIYYLKNDVLQKEMIRSTLANIIKEIPSAEQVHRSYIVNPSQIEKISGNTRKGAIAIRHLKEEIPISPKYFLGVKEYLQNRP